MIHLAERYIAGLPLSDSQRDKLREYVLMESFAYKVNRAVEDEGLTEEGAVERTIYEAVLGGL